MTFLTAYSWEMALGLLLAGGNAGEKPQPVERLPFPQEVQPEALPAPRLMQPETVVVPMPHYVVPDPYWRMRLYGRDRYGYLRPLVIYGPYGAYRPLTGEPYPYTPVRGVR